MDLHAAVLYDSYTLEQLDIYFSETNLFNNQVTYLEQQRGHEIRLHFFEETSYLLFKIIKEPISNRDQNSAAAKWKLVYLGRDDLKRDHGWRWEANSFSSGITDQLPSIGRVSIITQVLSPNSVCLLTFLPWKLASNSFKDDFTNFEDSEDSLIQTNINPQKRFRFGKINGDYWHKVFPVGCKKVTDETSASRTGHPKSC